MINEYHYQLNVKIVKYKVHAGLYGARGTEVCNFITCTNLIGAALLAAAEQVAYTHDTRPFLARV